MVQEKNQLGLSLCLFGEGADGNTGVAAAAAVTDAASQEQGVTARDAAVQQTREEAFLSLIKGEYRDLYDARVNDVVRRRLGEAHDATERLSALAPTLALIEQTLGVTPNDTDAIGQKLAELTSARKESDEHAEKEEKSAQRGEKRYRSWVMEAEQLTARYPHFDLKRELRSPRFRALLAAGERMQDAYLLAHGEEVTRAALAHAVRATGMAASRAVMSGAARPAENGIVPRATATERRDVSRFTRAEREEIMRRVLDGERVKL